MLERNEEGKKIRRLVIQGPVDEQQGADLPEGLLDGAPSHDDRGKEGEVEWVHGVSRCSFNASSAACLMFHRSPAWLFGFSMCLSMPATIVCRVSSIAGALASSGRT